MQIQYQSTKILGFPRGILFGIVKMPTLLQTRAPIQRAPLSGCLFQREEEPNGLISPPTHGSPQAINEFNNVRNQNTHI